MHLFSTLKYVLLLFILGINFHVQTFQEGYANNNGVEIFYRDYGPIGAKPIILIQG